jgi:hypothetical protein
MKRLRIRPALDSRVRVTQAVLGTIMQHDVNRTHGSEEHSQTRIGPSKRASGNQLIAGENPTCQYR